MVYTLRFFSSKCNLFHNSSVFGSCIIHILYTGVLKLIKNNSGTKSLILTNVLPSNTTNFIDIGLSVRAARFGPTESHQALNTYIINIM